jgi:hypothetical protein
METLVAGGAVDVIGIARPMAFVPDYPARILAGEREPVLPTGTSADRLSAAGRVSATRHPQRPVPPHRCRTHPADPRRIRHRAARTRHDVEGHDQSDGAAPMSKRPPGHHRIAIIGAGLISAGQWILRLSHGM